MIKGKDPFYVVKEGKLDGLIARLQADLVQWNELKTRSGPEAGGLSVAHSQQWQAVAHSLIENLHDVDKYLNDLDQTIIIVETHRDRFAAITEDELTYRRKFLQETHALMARAQALVYSDEAKKVLGSLDPGVSPPRLPPVSFAASPSAAAAAAPPRSPPQQQTQEELETMQNVAIEQLGLEADRAKKQAEAIHGALRSDSKDLGELDDGVDEAVVHARQTNSKLQNLHEQARRNPKLCIIIVLLVVVILLVVIVLA